MENFWCRIQLGNKDSKYSFKQNIFDFPNTLWYNFINDEKFEEERLSSKNNAKFKDFTMPKHSSSGFFLSIKLCIKRILATPEYSNL